MRLVDADAFFEDFPEIRDYEWVSQEYEVDAVPVVRCGECVNWDCTWENDNWSKDVERHYCPMVDLVTRTDWFCADGERYVEND